MKRACKVGNVREKLLIGLATLMTPVAAWACYSYVESGPLYGGCDAMTDQEKSLSPSVESWCVSGFVASGCSNDPPIGVQERTRQCSYGSGNCSDPCEPWSPYVANGSTAQQAHSFMCYWS